MIDLIAWLTNTATIGGLVVLTVFVVAITAYIWMVRWICAGGETDGHP